MSWMYWRMRIIQGLYLVLHSISSFRSQLKVFCYCVYCLCSQYWHLNIYPTVLYPGVGEVCVKCVQVGGSSLLHVDVSRKSLVSQVLLKRSKQTEVSALPTANRTCHSLRAEYVSVSTAAFACINQAFSVFKATGGDVTAGSRNASQTARVFNTRP